MAESILFGIATEVLKKIGSLVRREMSLLWDLESDLRRLEGTLRTIKAVLMHAEKKQAEDDQLRDWLGQLKDVFYDAEDVLEEFEFEASRREMVKQHGSSIRKVRQCFSSSSPVVFSSIIAHKIKKIRERLDQIAEDRQKFHLVESHVVVRHISPNWRETDHHLKPSEYIIGREDDKEKIKNFLMQSTAENVSVMPIVGIGGLGKTTLTKMVYNDEQLKEFFKLKMWVCVSNDFDVPRLRKEIFCSAIGKDPEHFKANVPHERLQEILAAEKFFLVLDDVWNEKPMKWMDLRGSLMNGVNGSKIIISTRSKRVAEIMGTVPPHFIQGLSPDESLSLFKKLAFKDEKGEDFKNLVEIGKEIVRKCRGVPLAVRTLGGLLYANTEEDEWERIKRSDIWQVEQGEEDILPALKLSYDHLPSHLKRCFAYLSLFPKDYVYDAEYTVQDWMALGLLVTSDETEELEDVGMRYVKKLLSRCFLEEFWELHCFYYKFRMHDLMHDLALSVAQNECSLINSRGQKVDEMVRHFSINVPDFCGQQVPEFLVNNSRGVRSIIFARKQYEHMNASFIRTCFSKFNYLRLLFLNSILFEVLPDSVGKLIHLKCLDLSYNNLLKKLPESICQLLKLQTFRLMSCTALQKLPCNIGKMTGLRYLEICTKEKHLPKNGIECLSSLQYFYLSNCPNLVSLFEGMQSGLPALRTLLIQNCPCLISLPHSITRLPRLETLVIWSCRIINLNMEWQGEDRQQYCLRLQRFITFDLPSAVDLPRVILEGSAHTLKCMRIEGCPNLAALPRWFQNLTSLQKLEIRSCPRLPFFPEGMLQCLTALKELKIHGCPDLSESCKRDESEIAHIQEVHL